MRFHIGQFRLPDHCHAFRIFDGRLRNTCCSAYKGLSGIAMNRELSEQTEFSHTHPRSLDVSTRPHAVRSHFDAPSIRGLFTAHWLPAFWADHSTHATHHPLMHPWTTLHTADVPWCTSRRHCAPKPARTDPTQRLHALPCTSNSRAKRQEPVPSQGPTARKLRPGET